MSGSEILEVAVRGSLASLEHVLKMQGRADRTCGILKKASRRPGVDISSVSLVLPNHH